MHAFRDGPIPAPYGRRLSRNVASVVLPTNARADTRGADGRNSPFKGASDVVENLVKRTCNTELAAGADVPVVIEIATAAERKPAGAEWGRSRRPIAAAARRALNQESA